MARDPLDFVTGMRDALDAKAKGIAILWAEPLGDSRYDCTLELGMGKGAPAPVCGIATLDDLIELAIDEPRLDLTVGVPGVTFGPVRAAVGATKPALDGEGQQIRDLEALLAPDPPEPRRRARRRRVR